MSSPKFRIASKVPAITVPEGMEASYANVARIAHTPSEIVFDFALKLPGAIPANVTARVLMSPLSAKLFHRALAENLAKFEKLFGEIKIPGQANLEEYSKLFKPPQEPDAPGESKEGE